MQAACAAGLVFVLRQADGMRVVVDGMKVLNFASAAQMLGDDVGGENGIDVLGAWPGIVGGAAGRAERVGQMVFGQNTLDRSFAGHRTEMQLFEARLHSTGADQAITSLGSGSLFEQHSQ